MRIVRAEPLHLHHFHDEQIGLIDNLFVKRVRQKPNFNREMFDQDFGMLFPPMNRRGGELFDVVSNDGELSQRLLGNVKTRYAPHTIDETIRELVEEIARSLICFGRAFYFLHSKSEQEEIHVASFSPSSVVRLFGTHVQWVPKRRETHWDRDDEELPREIRILDAARVMRFDMPKSIERLLSMQNRTLAALDKHQLVGNEIRLQATHENPNPTNHFNFPVWNDMQERALFRATRSTGWSGRKYHSSKRSEFFVCHRLIRFRRNQLLLRDSILNQLSGELSRIGNGYKSEYSIEISGNDELPSVAYLNELEVRLAREQVGFAVVIDYCLKR